MTLSEQQRADALTILANSGGRIPLFHIQPPKPLAEMAQAEPDQFAKDAAEKTGQLVDHFLENVYEVALTKHVMAKAHQQRSEPPD